jgi:hypothetical protein
MCSFALPDKRQDFMHVKRSLFCGVALVVAFGVVAPVSAAFAATSKPTIVIGSTNFEEQAIVFSMAGTPSPRETTSPRPFPPIRRH